MTNQATKINPIILPWGEEVYAQIPLHKAGDPDKFYARHGKTAEGREYIEFSKFGPRPNTEGETYSQKFRLYEPEQWTQIKELMETELLPSIGWESK